MEIPLERERQTELADPIKVRFTGKLRSRIDERQWDYVATTDGDGGWEVADDADPFSAAAYRATSRQKTNVVIETVEEAYSFLSTMTNYRAGDVTWMNGPMVKTARRVFREVREGVEAEGYEVEIDKYGCVVTVEES